MDQKQTAVNGASTAELGGIKKLLMSLHGEVKGLEAVYGQVLEALRTLEDKVELDDLTGLFRRGAFFKRWEKLIQECVKLGEVSGVLLVDIDHFKSINDNYGHATGDDVIRKVADLLKRFERSNTVTGRLGGEEFVVAMKGTEAEFLATAEFIRRGAEKLHGEVVGSEGKVHWKCTVSVGVANSNHIGMDPDQLLQAADEALYDAKRSGRNQVKAA